MVKILSRIKSSLTNNENKNGSINLYLLNTYVKRYDFTLVDTGCGTGSNLNDIISRYPDAKIIGIDNYKPDLDIAKNFFSNKAEFLYCDCLDIKLDSNTVDIVLSNQVIEHIAEYEKYLSEIKRILKNKGLFILSTPNFLHPRNVLLKLFFQKPIMRWENNKNLPANEFRGHIKEFYEDELIALLEKYNFKLLQSSPIVPEPTLKGNAPFILYRFAEYIFFIFTKPFVGKGYSKNHNMIFENN
tara:strand:+ start:243 stop:971 length:729 start_codon:yes stop_codon:yes gene_type:complete